MGFPLWPMEMGVPMPDSLTTDNVPLGGFPQALPFILDMEGGFVDHPDDRGGATNFGVTQAVYDADRDRRALARQSVRHISEAEVAAIYYRGYWVRGRCDEMPWPLALVHFDGCVNLGTGGAAKVLQRALGVADDGQIGPVTMAAIGRARLDGLVERVLWERLSYYAGICRARPTQRTFLLGWLNRILHLRTRVTTGRHDH